MFSKGTNLMWKGSVYLCWGEKGLPLTSLLHGGLGERQIIPALATEERRALGPSPMRTEEMTTLLAEGVEGRHVPGMFSFVGPSIKPRLFSGIIFLIWNILLPHLF